jgi:hypothetical protein
MNTGPDLLKNWREPFIHIFVHIVENHLCFAGLPALPKSDIKTSHCGYLFMRMLYYSPAHGLLHYLKKSFQHKNSWWWKIS